MKKYLLASTLLIVLLLSGCGKMDNKEVIKSTNDEPNESRTFLESITNTSTVESSYQVMSGEETIETTTLETANLGTIYYENLDTADPIQAKAKYFGCYIEDDGTTVNFIPSMSATVQNLQLYMSGNGNEDYYNDFLTGAIEVSLLTDGKPINIYNVGLGEVIITAIDGIVIYSI
ncbi:hypothetical protein [Candidatus Enterococcus clewellii]|uniref:Lipoprotein n=1 Tax=Candidatus Enterococcus clewellii TaxID=1834193 RepID=A0A242K7L5_9ENTE|nr:hypothetical protein [Enterococcus sp. 9E7_DIV0242]OTP17165.1 hypothetical protein A5888_001303 [Enterococcus sp. 9E7_DIV0242]